MIGTIHSGSWMVRRLAPVFGGPTSGGWVRFRVCSIHSTSFYDPPNKAVLRQPLEPEQYLSIRYAERLAENGVVASVGSRGDSYDNALAETIIGLYKTQLIRNRGPWRGLDDLELATLEWVDWFNHRRLFHELGRIPPAEFETNHYRQDESHHQVETHTTEPA